MTISLNASALPATLNGLRWSDEYDWSATQTATAPSLTGALIVQAGTRSAGRPLTLTGGREWAWCTRAQLDTLAALLDTASTLTLTLHDGRQLPVLPRTDGDGPLRAAPLPRVRDSGPAAPAATDWYVVESIRLLIVGPIVEPAP